jgi:hypothetical protein
MRRLTSTQLQELFGALRSTLAEDTSAPGWADRLLELSRRAHAIDEGVWGEQWASYILAASHRFPDPLFELESLERFHDTAPYLPGARVTLDLMAGVVARDDAMTLAQSPYLGAVTSLSLWIDGGGDGFAVALAGSAHAASLTSLSVSDSGIGVRGARAIARSPHLAGLTSLILYGNDVRGEGVEALARSPNFPSLTDLDLVWNAIGARGVKAVEESVQLAGVRVRL